MPQLPSLEGSCSRPSLVSGPKDPPPRPVGLTQPRTRGGEKVWHRLQPGSCPLLQCPRSWPMEPTAAAQTSPPGPHPQGQPSGTWASSCRAHIRLLLRPSHFERVPLQTALPRTLVKAHLKQLHHPEDLPKSANHFGGEFVCVRSLILSFV